jgi:hypothetical protein
MPFSVLKKTVVLFATGKEKKNGTKKPKSQAD